ncbi:uncharacterized protein LOC144438844 isoform X2 [Glandiceps talaboti]
MGKRGGVHKVMHFTEDARTGKIRIRQSPISEFQATENRGYFDNIRRYKYDVSIPECQLKRRGTCCPAKSNSAAKVLRRARRCYRDGLPADGEYNLQLN